MDTYLLSILLFTPLAAALICLVLPEALAKGQRWVAMAASVIQLLVLVRIFNVYQLDAGGYQLMERAEWITLSLGNWGTFKAEYLVALDGLNFSLIALSVVVLLIATLSSWTVSLHRKGYFALLLVLNTAIIGSFASLDLLLFYLFFEFMLLPMYFLIGIWGGPRREYASIKFFLYTLLGSILILVVIIGLYLSSSVVDSHSFSLIELSKPETIRSTTILHPTSDWSFLGLSARLWAFLLLLIGFAIKLPSVPFHTWLPDAHVEASTPISIILAALLLKIGGYGLARMAYPIFPDAAIHFSTLVALMGMISILYGALNALASKDIKRLIAYSSVSHMGFVLLGFSSATVEGISGALFQMTSHGFISAMLFLLAGVLYDRTQDRLIENYSGLAGKMPVYTSMILVAFLATLGLPGFSGFIGEVLVIFGSFGSSTISLWIVVLSLGGLILGAGYCLWLIQRMFFGPYIQKVPGDLPDLTIREKLMLLPLAGIIFLLGIFPQNALKFINTFSQLLSEQLSPFVTP